MAKLFGLNKPNTNLRKNVFDLSEQTLFSMSAGMLVPCMVREMNPGEKAQINMSALTRSFPLNTAAYVRTRQYFHFFFVPYKQLWSGWDNFINGVNYKTSALQKGQQYNNVPRLDLFKVIAQLLQDGWIFDKESFDRRKAYEKPQGFRPRYRGDANLTPNSSKPEEHMGPVFHEESELSRREDAQERLKNRGRDEFGFEVFRGISRLLDMLGYGFTKKGEDISSLSAYIEKKLEDVKGSTDPKFTAFIEELKSNSFSVNPFRLLAYQKIYSDFYKRDDYEATDPFSFNMDDIGESFGVTLNKMNYGYKRYVNMFRLRYRWLPKDYFTGIVPSELFGVPNVVDDFFASKENRQFGKLNGDNYPNFGGFNLSSDDSSVQIDIDGNFTTKSIRAAFAIEKLYRLTRRASGFDYINQTAAHYGFDVPKGRGDKVEFIGGFSNSINISEVITTANTEKGATGDVNGRGIGVSADNKDFDFTAKEHGVLMCITSILPEAQYSSEGMNRFNVKFDRGDYFHPEFQDLGLQPVFGYELKNYVASDISDSVRNNVLGYVPMYSEYKTAYDTLHGEFRNGGDLAQWSASSLVAYDSTGEGSSGAIISTLKCNPRVLDRIFSINFDGREKTDQFMVSAQFDCKMIRPMSITGQQL